MKISMHAMSVDLLTRARGNLSAILETGKASAENREVEPAVLLASRLAPDMFPLTRQVQIACDVAKSAVARLAAQEPPRFPDTESSFEELHA